MNENQKTAGETDKSVSEKFNENFSKRIEEEVQNLKKDFFQKAEAIAVSEDQKEAIQELLEEAIKHKSPSVSQRDLREYERVRGEFSPKDEGRKPIAIGFH